MAGKLPSALDLQERPAPAETPQIRVGQIDYGPAAAGGKAIAEGIAGIGGGLKQIGLATQEVDDYGTRKKLLDFKLQTEMQHEEFKRNMPPGGAGYAASWQDQYQKAAADFVGKGDGNIPASQRAKVGMALKQQEVMLSERAQRYEAQERDKYTIDGLETTLGRTRDQVAAKPDERDRWLQEGHGLIDQSQLMVADKYRLKQKYTKEVDKAYGDALVNGIQSKEDLDRAREIMAPNMPDRRAEKAALSGASPSFRPEVNAAIDAAASKYGVDPAMLRAFAKIESGGDPGNTTGSYKGLFQLSNSEFQKHGGRGDIYDPAANAEAAAIKLKAEAQQFESKHGRAPTPAEIYLVHQQGEAGAAAHLANPDAPAWQNMASTGEGRQKGERWSKLAIWGNIPSDMKRQFGSVENVTSADFMKLWKGKVARFGAGTTTAAEDTQAQSDAYRGPMQSLSIDERRAIFNRADTRFRQMIGDTDKVLKEHESGALQGRLPSQEELTSIKRRVDDLGDPLLAAKYNSFLAKANISQTLLKAPPGAGETWVQGLEDDLTRNGSSKEGEDILKHAKAQVAETRKQVNDNPMGWAQKNQIEVPMADGPPSDLESRQHAQWKMPTQTVQLEQLNFDAPDIDMKLARRIEQAKGVGRYYGQPPQIFTQNERDFMKDRLASGGPSMINVMGKIAKSAAMQGIDPASAMREFSKDAPELGIIGEMVATNADPNILDTASKAMAWKAGMKDKFESTIDKNQAKPSLGEFADVLATQPTRVDAVKHTANLIYEYESRRLGKNQFDSSLYEDIVGRVLGQTKDAQGNTYGGVGRQGTGWTDGKWSSGGFLGSTPKVHVPQEIRSDGFDDMIGALRARDLLDPPRDGAGNPLPIGDIRKATWVSVGPGKYVLEMKRDADGNRVVAQKPGGETYVLDIRPLLPAIQKRKPEIFRGYDGSRSGIVEPDTPYAHGYAAPPKN